MRLGTWTTIDCPTDKRDLAKAYLTEQFDLIGGNVRVVTNPHDFGSYPSFEIDMPSRWEADTEEGQEALRDIWVDRANEIEEAYSLKFQVWL